ncbi:F5/8 type C domain-containing protein [Micromonospora phaseoli]|uniref:F5/8 type C domain-containing protein n=1 Tax=Micromonospora phaseoli TaxID=1144548 RepID=A0A1H6VIL7_9ACTN|nr:discoidin domain-containing protein [Micromonospora phaseoli]PZV93691.1 F5/8 type C domain-containing protein [Micromonospora phaseoli]GIJ79171.1 lectin [Micromonospora phaseoli]SEJ00075.1 F5/8 type C domain-containing protein [Micromonospora phaseoli]
MALTRRTLIGSIAAGSALAALGDALPTGTPAQAASPPGDVVGKITVGYQGWFSCPGDGAPIGGWWHWSRDRFQPPSPNNTTIVSWPDMREYAHSYPTAYPNLGNGQPATLFSSYDQQTVDTHFRWMQEHGCDTAALQRFNPFGDEGPTRDAMAVKVRGAAERFGRKFYIMYDVTDWTAMQSQIKQDWTTKMSAYTASAAYARQNGKPVVCIWGFGFNDPGRPFTAAPCLDVVNWFKAQGCYVIGGVPTYWRQGINDSRAGFSEVYHAFDMISPWMVGRTGTLAGLDDFHTNVNVPDLADCAANGIDYQPCVMPGDLSAGHRRHGDFYWRHLYNMIRLGAQGLYVSMFDEYNEGNQIAKTSETQASTPAGVGIRALDEDGTFCSADYYLRITADGGRMLKGQLALTPVRPTSPVTGGGSPPTGNLAAGRPATASSQNGPFTAANAVDGNGSSYWEGTNNAFPQWWQVDLGGGYPVNRVVLALPSGWEARTQTLSVQGSADGATFATLAAAVGVRFDPATGNTATVTVPATTVRHLRVTVTGNTAWPAAQLAQVEVYATTGTPDPPVQTDLARSRPTADSSHVQSYGSGNVVDGDPGSYWESLGNAFPQWVQVDLGTASTVGRVVLRLPPSAAWQTRTQTLSVLGSTDGTAWTTLVAAAGRVFDPATGNQVSLALTATAARYVRVRFTGNTGWPAGQLAQFEVYSA